MVSRVSSFELPGRSTSHELLIMASIFDFTVKQQLLDSWDGSRVHLTLARFLFLRRTARISCSVEQGLSLEPHAARVWAYKTQSLPRQQPQSFPELAKTSAFATKQQAGVRRATSGTTACQGACRQSAALSIRALRAPTQRIPAAACFSDA